MSKKKVPAKEGWYTMDEAKPQLIGSRCTSCKSYFFPKQSLYCANPSCDGEKFEDVPLSRTGKIWSYTNTCYAPPAPYVPTTDPFQPFAIAAVELEAEKMVVLGQVVKGVDVDKLKLGMKMELVLETLYEDDQNEYLVWKWKPVAA